MVRVPSFARRQCRTSALTGEAFLAISPSWLGSVFDSFVPGRSAVSPIDYSNTTWKLAKIEPELRNLLRYPVGSESQRRKIRSAVYNAYRKEFDPQPPYLAKRNVCSMDLFYIVLAYRLEEAMANHSSQAYVTLLRRDAMQSILNDVKPKFSSKKNIRTLEQSGELEIIKDKVNEILKDCPEVGTDSVAWKWICQKMKSWSSVIRDVERRIKKDPTLEPERSWLRTHGDVSEDGKTNNEARGKLRTLCSIINSSKIWRRQHHFPGFRVFEVPAVEDVFDLVGEGNQSYLWRAIDCALIDRPFMFKFAEHETSPSIPEHDDGHTNTPLTAFNSSLSSALGAEHPSAATTSLPGFEDAFGAFVPNKRGRH